MWMWCIDTAGQERFQTILPAYYRGAHGVMLCYDVTDEKSYQNVAHWIKSIETHSSQCVQTVLVGNKADMDSERVVSSSQGEELAKKYSTSLFETSARSGVNVNEAFEAVIRSII